VTIKFVGTAIKFWAIQTTKIVSIALRS